MKTEKRRMRGILATLVADPYRKLAAVVLAIGLWFFINSQIIGEVTRPVPLMTVGSLRTREEGFGSRLVVVLPTDRVVGRRFMDGDRAIDSVVVRLKGPRFRIDALAAETLDLQIAGFAGLDWSTRKDIEFTAADIRRDLRALQDVSIELQPPRVRLEVERIDEWQLPLSLDVVELSDDQLGNRLRRDTAEFSPETARILGPASVIAQFRAPGPKPLLARLRGVGNERQVTAILELRAGTDAGLRLAETPSVTMRVLPVTSVFELELPLSVDDLALGPELRGVYQPEVRARLVRIRAGGELRSRLVLLGEGSDRQKQQKWASENMRLLVYVPRLEPGAAYGPEIVREASLLLLGPLQDSVDRTECLLDEDVSVTLRRQQ